MAYASKMVIQILQIITRVMLLGSRHVGRSQNYSPMRLPALEARAMKRANLITILYLPVIFLSYGFVLGKMAVTMLVLCLTAPTFVIGPQLCLSQNFVGNNN